MYLELWVEGEEERLSCAVKAVADFKGLRRQRTKHLETETQVREGGDYKVSQAASPCTT